MTSSSSSDLERPQGADTWYDVLEVDRDVDGTGLAVAYERAIALIEGRRVGGYLLLDPDAAVVARADIDAAFAVLSNPERRKVYDRSLDGDDTDGPTPKTQTTQTTPPSTTQTTPPTTSTPPRISFLAPVDDNDGSSDGNRRERERVAVRRGGIAFATPKTDKNDVKALLAAAAAVTSPPAPTLPTTTTTPTTPTTTPTTTLPPTTELWPAIGPDAVRKVGLPTPTPTPTPTPLASLFSLDGEVNGQTIRRLREARRIDLTALAELTKIRKLYLAAIEDNDLENLPSRVYLRGFLTQIARVLRVDKVKLSDGYLAFIARFGR